LVSIAQSDGDSRIVAIEAGFLGYWGEWHMEKGFPGRDVQDLVQAAFHKVMTKELRNKGDVICVR
jgi:hypothetical protein